MEEEEEEEEEDIIKLTQRGLDLKFSRPHSNTQLTVGMLIAGLSLPYNDMLCWFCSAVFYILLQIFCFVLFIKRE